MNESATVAQINSGAAAERIDARIEPARNGITARRPQMNGAIQPKPRGAAKINPSAWDLESASRPKPTNAETAKIAVGTRMAERICFRSIIASSDSSSVPKCIGQQL